MQDGVYSGTMILEGRKSIKAGGVTAVNGFSSAQITITASDVKMTITGSDLKISSFSKESGDFEASGLITGIKFSGGGGRLKIFK